MSEIISIKATERCAFGTANTRRIRREGLVPVVVYSHGQEPIALTIDAASAAKIENHTGIIELADESKGAKYTALVKEVQINPLTTAVIHIDFLAVKADEVVESTVEIEATGDAVGTRSGGQLEQVLHTLEIKSKPADIPEKIVVDVTNLDVNQALHVKDLVLPNGVTAMSDADLIVFHVRETKAEAAAAAPAEETK